MVFASIRQPTLQTKLNSGLVRLRNSAEILVRGPRLWTRICVHAMIGLLKEPLSIFTNQVEGKFETHFR